MKNGWKTMVRRKKDLKMPENVYFFQPNLLNFMLLDLKSDKPRCGGLYYGVAAMRLRASDFA